MRCIAMLVLVLSAAGSAVPDAAAQEPRAAAATAGRCGTLSASTITTSADLQCMLLLPTQAGGDARAVVELVQVRSPFGVAVTPEGRHRWNVVLRVERLPTLEALEAAAFVAWATTPSFDPVVRLGTVSEGVNKLGEVAFNKFTIWVSAERTRGSTVRQGPIVLRGNSPSSRMQPEDLITRSPMAILGPMPSNPASGAPTGTADRQGSMPPMHPAVPILPGLMTLRPKSADWLPSVVDLEAIPWAQPQHIVTLGDGGTMDLEAGLIRREIGNRVLLMYGFNEQYPGPLLRVPEKATIFVNLHNATELPTSIHWHGVRLDNRFDGVPGLTQDPVLPGETFRYQIYFRDAGIYWYHPHHREDIAQDLGLYGNMLVEPEAGDYYNEVDGEAVLMLDDLLLGEQGLVPYGESSANYMLMGRFGNQLLINGEPAHTSTARGGDVVRYYFTNVSNTRTFNLSFRPVARDAGPAGDERGRLGGAEWALADKPLRLRVVAADISRFERERWAESLVIAPAERYVVEVRMPGEGEVALINTVQAINHRKAGFFTEATEMARIAIIGSNADPTPVLGLREHPEVVAEMRRLRPEFDRPVDHELVLRLQAHDLPLVIEQLMSLDRIYFNPVEWAGTMAGMNWVTTGAEIDWQLFDPTTAAVNDDIKWRFVVGDVVKIRLRNERESFHAMQHPVHFHGQRFVVLEQDGVRNDNLAWKDTVLVPAGSTIDLLLELSNPGKWMVHCHIAEHLESGMKMAFVVAPEPSASSSSSKEHDS